MVRASLCLYPLALSRISKGHIPPLHWPPRKQTWWRNYSRIAYHSLLRLYFCKVKICWGHCGGIGTQGWSFLWFSLLLESSLPWPGCNKNITAGRDDCNKKETKEFWSALMSSPWPPLCFPCEAARVVKEGVLLGCGFYILNSRCTSFQHGWRNEESTTSKHTSSLRFMRPMTTTQKSVVVAWRVIMINERHLSPQLIFHFSIPWVYIVDHLRSWKLRIWNQVQFLFCFLLSAF